MRRHNETMYPTFISTHSFYVEYIHNTRIHVKHNAVHNALGRRCLFDLNLRANRGHSQMKIDMEMLSLMICFLCLPFFPSYLIFHFYIRAHSAHTQYTYSSFSLYTPTIEHSFSLGYLYFCISYNHRSNCDSPTAAHSTTISNGKREQREREAGESAKEIS